MCAAQVPGDTYRNLVIHPTFSARTFKHILVPLWLLTYTYGAKVFHVLVNGVDRTDGRRVPEELLEGLLPRRRDYHSGVDCSYLLSQNTSEDTMFERSWDAGDRGAEGACGEDAGAADAPRAERADRRAVPAASRRRCSGSAASGAPRRSSGKLPGVYTTAVGYAAGFTPNPTYREVCSGDDRAQRSRARGVRSEEGLLRRRCSRRSGRATIRRRACGRGTTSARSTDRASTSSTRRSARRRSARATSTSAR